MAKQLIALAVSDIHFHDWKQFNENGERTKTTESILGDLFMRSDYAEVPILFSGDLFHTPKAISTVTLFEFTKFMKYVTDAYPGARMLGITGNHDGPVHSSLWSSMCLAYPENLINIDNNYKTIQYKEGGTITVFGLPYRRRNVKLVDQIKSFAKHPNKNKILLLHTELYGAPDPSGYESTPQNFSRESLALFKDFDLVLAGHIHKHTQIKNNVYMVGAPNQQRKSDAGTEMGYLEIYDDFSVEFVNTKAPEFKTYKEGEEHEDTPDYWVEIPKPKKIKKSSEAEFKANMDKSEMAKKYAEETGIKNRKKIKALIEILNKTDD